MPSPIACVLSYGLMCTSGDVIAEVPPPTPLIAVAVDPGGDDEADEVPADEATKGEASKVLAEVQAFYDATTDLSAQFQQTYVHPVYGVKTVSKGKLRVKKPGKMVWEVQPRLDWHKGKAVLYLLDALDLAGDDVRARLSGLAARLEPALASGAPLGQDVYEEAVRAEAEALGATAGELIHPCRVALTGQTRSAGMWEVMELIGGPCVVARLRAAGA